MHILAIFLFLRLSIATLEPGITISVSGGSPAAEAPVGSSDTNVVQVWGDPDIDPAPLYARFENGLYFRLEDTTTKILHPSETIDYRVIFTPPSAGWFSDAIIFTFINSQGKVMERRVDLAGIGLTADVRQKQSNSTMFSPNPANDRIYFTDKVRSAKLIDMLGTEVGQATDVEGMEVKGVPPGRYQIIIISQDGSTEATPVVILR